MKRLSTLMLMVVFCLFNANRTFAQQVTLITNQTTSYSGIYVDGNTLYLSKATGIQKLNLLEDNASPQIVVSGLTGVGALLKVENTLYTSDGNEDLIINIDISQSSPDVNTVTYGADYARGLAIYNNYLYIAERDGARISKLDLSSDSPVLEPVITTISPYSLQVHDGYLYYSQIGLNKISKIDLNVENPVAITVKTGFSKPNDIAIYGNDLYVAEQEANKISKIDLTANNPEIVDVLTNLGSPRALFVYDNQLYFSEVSNNSISKIDLTTLSTEQSNKQDITIHPNPAKDYFHIKNLTHNADYEIYNVMGKRISSGKFSIGKPISISHLNTRIYFLSIKNLKRIKFIKS